MKMNIKRKFALLAVSLAVAVSCASAISAEQMKPGEGKNLCYPDGKLVGSSGWINDQEKDEFLIDGNVDTKWCAAKSNIEDTAENKELLNLGYYHWAVIDFGEVKYFDSYTILQASLGSVDYGNLNCNALAWTIQITDQYTPSPDDSSKNEWETVNIVELHYIDPTLEQVDVYVGVREARYVRILLSVPESGGTTVRMPELMVYECKEGTTATGISSGLGEFPEIVEEVEIEGYFLEDGEFSVGETGTQVTGKHIATIVGLAVVSIAVTAVAARSSMKKKPV
jgi:hypothetical protein